MANKAEIVISQIKANCSDAFCVDLFKKVEGLNEKASPAQQGKFIKASIEEINKSLGTQISEKIMRPCGYQCISNQTILKAKKFYQEANGDVPAFLELLNNNHIGGGKLHTQENKIIGIYEKCYCGIPKNTKNMPKEYCECSAGWFEKLFSSVFEKVVKVTRLQTILAGDDSCLFEMEY